ncbi:MAG: tetratricopeptide repeat protein [Syntrophaceae bacterium]|nr:tetratricopeptide repeat protein [Syntrophaceae bacterium]
MEINTAADLLFSATMPTTAMMENIAGSALGRGIDALMAKDYNTAIREFRHSISLSPFSDNALSAFEYMAKALEGSGKTQQAITTYKQAIDVFPSADGLNLALGNLLYSENRYEEALAQYATAVRKNNAVSQNFYSLGQGYLALGRYDEAEAQFKKVIQMSPQDSGGYYALGQAYRMVGRYDEAKTQLDKALSIEKDSDNAHYELGMVYALQQQISKAQAELAILKENDSSFFTDLQYTINENSAPRFILAYVNGLNLASAPGTQVSSLDPSLAEPGASKNFTMTFVFDKDMDLASVQNIANWNISRSVSIETGGFYNWGRQIPETEISLSPMPLNVAYDPDLLTAKVTFKIAQNDSGNGTIDLSHLVFKFGGEDIYGNAMDTAKDQYNSFSAIV